MHVWVSWLCSLRGAKKTDPHAAMSILRAQIWVSKPIPQSGEPGFPREVVSPGSEQEEYSVSLGQLVVPEQEEARQAGQGLSEAPQRQPSGAPDGPSWYSLIQQS